MKDPYGVSITLQGHALGMFFKADQRNGQCVF